MVEIICSRSGLTFEAENKRTKVHPKINCYTSHKNTQIRYLAIEVITRGKDENWQTIEKFENEIKSAIEKALQPKSTPDWNICVSDGTANKGFLAKIVAADAKWRYQRFFLAEVLKEGRHRYYKIDSDGVYEARSYSAKGNCHKNFYLVTNGDRVEITENQVEELFPALSLNSKDEVSDTIVEECWECGAQYTTYGNVEVGNMSCKRCG